MIAGRRGIAARLGIAALNLLAPGAGLLRVGRGRLGAFLLLVPIASLLAVLLLCAVLPQLSFGALIGLVGLVAAGILAPTICSVVMTFLGSGHREEPRPRYSRWYVVTGVVLGSSRPPISSSRGSIVSTSPFTCLPKRWRRLC
ncbi:MAG: hypothetical protein QOE79_2785 [Sphingomonadales bacterium]|jgi:hypothetical protein|nr:hypothetical protein [Sphingomonadales bacterium]